MKPPLSLSRLLRPRSIAVVGGKWCEAVLHQLDLLGYEGELWVVNHRRDDMGGRPCLASLSDLPGVPDAVFLAVTAETAIEMTAALSAMGAGGVICFASGFSELGEKGRERQARLIAAAGDMPLIGPNCYGIINYLDRATLWPDQHGGKPVERGAAIITQSGNMALNLTMQRRGLPLAYVMTLGNQAMVGMPEVIETLLEDERVTAIGLHLEGLGDIAGFERAALKALARKVPIVALKSGRTAASARIALSHTASLTGQDALYSAFFKRLGIARVPDVPELLETLKFLSLAGPLAGNKVASMSCSGGEAGLIADLAEGRDLDFAQPGESDRAAIQASLNEYVSVSNPLDYHTFVWGDEDATAGAFTAMMKSGYDATMVVLDFPRGDRCDQADWWVTVRAMARATKASGKVGVVLSSMSENLPEAEAEEVVEAGLVPLQGLTGALTVLECAAALGRAQAKAPPVPLLAASPTMGEARQLDEWTAKRRLAGLGLSVPASRIAEDAGDAVAAAAALGGPVAVKALSDSMAHKTELGGVALNLEVPEEIAAAAQRMLKLAPRLLIERMVEGAVAELIVGMDRDPQFGPYLVLGAGGVLVELERDSQALLLPASEDEVRSALAGLKCYPLLEGYRGRPAGDVEAVVASVMALARFIEAECGRLEEIDINPLMVLPAGQGAVVADALIRIVEEDRSS